MNWARLRRTVFDLPAARLAPPVVASALALVVALRVVVFGADQRWGGATEGETVLWAAAAGASLVLVALWSFGVCLLLLRYGQSADRVRRGCASAGLLAAVPAALLLGALRWYTRGLIPSDPVLDGPPGLHTVLYMLVASGVSLLAVYPGITLARWVARRMVRSGRWEVTRGMSSRDEEVPL